ncbi:MAG: hypothetical protein NZZ41_07665 [Candidatus Dojkabacteria bacterium]|nr:hypothetical protein [Candidatus Dojkabacteria bacterium]
MSSSDRFDEKFLLFYKGGKFNSEVALSGRDIKNILPKISKKPFTVIFYYDIPEKIIEGINIILFIYQGADYGHWCFLDVDHKQKKIYFLILMEMRLIVSGHFSKILNKNHLLNLNYRNL